MEGMYKVYRPECKSFPINDINNIMARVNGEGFPNGGFEFADCGGFKGFRSYVCSCVGDPWIQEVDEGMRRRLKKKQVSKRINALYVIPCNIENLLTEYEVVLISII